MHPWDKPHHAVSGTTPNIEGKCQCFAVNYNIIIYGEYGICGKAFKRFKPRIEIVLIMHVNL
jgi:hypothetical protein